MYGRWKRSQYLMGFTKIDFLFFVKKPLNVFSILFIILVHTHRYSREWFEYDSCASCLTPTRNVFRERDGGARGLVCHSGQRHQKLLPDQPWVLLHAAGGKRWKRQVLVPVSHVVHGHNLRPDRLHATTQTGDGHPAVSRHALPRRRVRWLWLPSWLPWGLPGGLPSGLWLLGFICELEFQR